MRFWFDTEFKEDGKTIDLISIGVVSEDGRTYYAEAYEFDRRVSHTGPWLAENVIPLLQGPVHTRKQIAKDLIEFFGKDPEIWAYFGSYDWVSLCQLYGTMMELPKGWPMAPLDLRQLAIHNGIPELPKQETPEHHALNDAIWTKRAWQFCLTGR